MQLFNPYRGNKQCPDSIQFQALRGKVQNYCSQKLAAICDAFPLPPICASGRAFVLAIMKALAKNTLARHRLPIVGYEECWYRWRMPLCAANRPILLQSTAASHRVAGTNGRLWQWHIGFSLRCITCSNITNPTGTRGRPNLHRSLNRSSFKRCSTALSAWDIRCT